MSDEMRVRAADYAATDAEENYDEDGLGDLDFEEPECEFCEDYGCAECKPEEFAEMHLKWTCDGAATITEAVEALQGFIGALESYRSDGFELSDPVDNSHFFLIHASALEAIAEAAADAAAESAEKVKVGSK